MSKSIIKIFGADVDGTLTNSAVYLSSSGEEILRFSRRDGHGFFLLRQAGIKTLVISGESNKIIESRCFKMAVDHVFLGIQEKVGVIQAFLEKHGYAWEEFAFIGDDLNDSGLLRMAGFSATPVDGEEGNKRIVDYVCRGQGGYGCVREFANLVIARNEEIEDRQHDVVDENLAI